LEAVRPHSLDVDVMPCGSYATATALADSSDIDLTVRVWSAPGSWKNSPREALGDLKRWLSYRFDDSVEDTERGLKLTFDNRGPAVQVLLLLPYGLPGNDQPQLATNGPASRWLTADPVTHADRVRARNAALGQDRFRKIVRLLKQLSRTGESANNAPSVSSFQLESLALSYFHAPFDVAEGLAGLLSFVAANPLAASAARSDMLPQAFCQHCRWAARQLNLAITAEADPAEVANQVFGQPNSAVAPC
jgi:hypothetical protein